MGPSWRLLVYLASTLGAFGVLGISTVFAVELPVTITYQGRLYDSSSNPIENTVDVRLDIYSQDGSCLLYSESKQLDLSSSSGFFSTQIGSVTGSNSRTSGVDPGLSMQAVFDNSSAKTGASSCSYTPSSRDGRKIQVTIVKIGSTTVNTVLSPKQNITSVPYATVAQTLQGKGAESFVQLTGSITQSDFEGLMAKKSELLNLAGQETALLALANGTSNTYLKSGSNISAAGDISLSAGKSLQLGTFSTAQETTLVSGYTSADIGKTWYNSDTNQLMYYDGTSAKAVNVVGGGGGISVVAGSAPISVANGSTSPTVSLNYGTGLTTSLNQLVPDFGTASGKVAQGNDSRFNPAISGASDAGKLVKVNSDGTAYEFIPTGALAIDSATSRVGIGTATPTNDLSLSGQAARVFGMERHSTVDMDGNDLTISSGGATIGAIDKNGGKLILSSGTSTGAGSSSIEFQTSTAGSAGTGDNAPSTKMTILGNGNIGIGTASPSVSLDMSGKTDAIRLPSGTTAERPVGTDGLLRYNSDEDSLEAYVNGAWTAVATAAMAVDLSGNQSVAGNKSFSGSATFSAVGPGLALDVTGSGGLQTTLLNVVGATTMTGNLNISSGKFFVDSAQTRVGIGTTSPSYDFSLSGTIARTLGMERHPAADTAGNNMILVAGGAATGATNKNGGDLYLKSGASTGIGSSNIFFQTATSGSTGTSDNSPSTKMVILGNGNIGVGTTNPQEKFQVDGGIRIGNSSTTCSPSTGGTIRWSGSAFEGCNGSNWVSLGGAAGSSPTNLAFTDVSGVSFNSVNCSSALTIAGLSVPTYASVPVGAPGSPYVKVNGSGTSTYGTVQSGNTLQVCATSPNTNLGNVVVPVTVGNLTTNWNLTSGNAQPNAFSFNNPGSPASVGMSVDNCSTANIQGLTIASPVTVSATSGTISGININNSGYVSYTGSHTISNNQSLCVRMTTNNTPSSAHVVTVTIGSGVTGVTPQSASYTVTNPAQDTTPNAFSITSTNGVERSYLVTSSPVAISGITGNVAISVSGGGSPAISIAGGAWVTSGTIQDGQSFTVRLTSSASFDTGTTATVTVGTVSANWTATTRSKLVLTWTTPGSHSWTVPAGVSSISKVYVIGAGGGGGTSEWQQVGGGGGGGLRYASNVSVTPGQSISVVVGAGGAGLGNWQGSPTGDGGSSSFGSITAYGGKSGVYSGGTTGVGGVGGGGSGGDGGFAGGNGGNNAGTGGGGARQGAGGGGAAGTTGNGQNGENATQIGCSTNGGGAGGGIGLTLDGSYNLTASGGGGGRNNGSGGTAGGGGGSTGGSGGSGSGGVGGSYGGGGGQNGEDCGGSPRTAGGAGAGGAVLIVY